MVDVALEIDDGRVMSATTRIGLTAADDVDGSALAARAVEISTVLHAVRSGIEVEVQVDSIT